MAFLDLVRRRRSVRTYAPDPVPREILDRCVEAARLAPSACNSQPWTFLLVDAPERRKRLAEAAFGGIYRMNSFAVQAPVLVAVLTERSRLAALLGGVFRGVQYHLLDVGIAVEHFVLQAAEEGLGTCWLGWFDERGVKRVLGLPAGARVSVLLSVGFPAASEEEKPRSSRKPLEEMRRYY
jgi:nitroreductase